jgi:hypothetical protein
MSKVLQFLLRVWFDGGLARSPIDRTHFVVGVGVLERFHEAQCLINRTTDWGFVHCHLTQCLLLIASNNKQPSQRVSGVFVKNAILGGNFLRQIRYERNIQFPKACLIDIVCGVVIE